MKVLRTVTAALALAGVAATAAVAAPKTLSGVYLEARDANVFVGACHFGSEYQEHGRDALLAWHVTSGARNGVSLDGLNVVAAVTADNNLAEAGAARQSVIYIDSRASAAQAAALTSLAKEAAGKNLGTVTSVRIAPVHFQSAGDRFSVEVPSVLAVTASRLADRACCIMPYQVWYHPLATVTKPIVGTALQNRYSGRDLNTSWSYPGQNSAFIGDFTVKL